MPITTGMLGFGMFFAFFIGLSIGGFVFIIYIGIKNKTGSMMINFDNPDKKVEVFKLKHHLGSGGARDKRLLTPTGISGVYQAMRKVPFGKVDVKVKKGNFISFMNKKGYPLLINGIDRLELSMHKLYCREVTKSQELQSRNSEMLIELEELRMNLGDAGKKALDQFIQYYKDARPFVKATSGKG